MRRLALFLLLSSDAGPAFAVQPDEILDDPVLEARARDRFRPGCGAWSVATRSIDELNADLARDLRLLVRERIMAGDTDEDVLSFVTDRYGEYVLLRPTAKGANLLLWVSGPLELLAALAVALSAGRKRRAQPWRTSSIRRKRRVCVN